jgi:N-acetylglucosamine-6-sulfatase
MRIRRTLALIVVAVLAFAAPAAANARPNVVVIETDDQTVSDLASMPHTRALFADEGVAFRNSFVSESQCCPSRATFLTGLYAHNHRVLSTNPPFGGFTAFDPSQTLAVWLQKAGYTTALIGKYFNGYGRLVPDYVPPGWTEWHGLLGPSVYSFFGFAINNNGRARTYPGQYETDVLTRLSARFIRTRAHSGRPFFLWTTYVAPHIGGPRQLIAGGAPTTVPSPLFSGASLGRSFPATAAFDEADVSDKPAAIARRRRFGPREIATLAEVWRLRQESLLSVDAGVGRLVGALRSEGVLRNTLLIFTSDNGYLIGEHRIRESKVLPYEPSIRVPLLMRGPGIPRAETRSQLVWNGDLAPTILDATGARAPWALDGQSLLPFARSPAISGARDVLLEGPPQGGLDSTPRFTGLRTRRYAYIEYHHGERELYDLRRDPDELDNRAADPRMAPLISWLARRLARMRACAGASCRR